MRQKTGSMPVPIVWLFHAQIISEPNLVRCGNPGLLIVGNPKNSDGVG
jgi:hypothetical protein